MQREGAVRCPSPPAAPMSPPPAAAHPHPVPRLHPSPSPSQPPLHSSLAKATALLLPFLRPSPVSLPSAYPPPPPGVACRLIPLSSPPRSRLPSRPSVRRAASHRNRRLFFCFSFCTQHDSSNGLAFLFFIFVKIGHEDVMAFDIEHNHQDTCTRCENFI